MEASLCKQHITIVAAGGGASLRFLTYSFMYGDIR